MTVARSWLLNALTRGLRFVGAHWPRSSFEALIRQYEEAVADAPLLPARTGAHNRAACASGGTPNASHPDSHNSVCVRSLHVELF